MNSDISMFYGANPQLFEYAKTLRRCETKAEKILWSKLLDNQLIGLKFRRQHPVKYFIADFYCHQAKLIIEVDGGIHQEVEQFEYDQNRDDELDLLGIKVLRIKNEEIEDSIEKVIEKIKRVIEERSN